MTALLSVIGVPSSAGAHHAGQDLAPAAIRAQGLVTRLQSEGLDVVDAGDVAGEVFRVDASGASARNVDAVVRVARAVADAVEDHARSGRVPVVIGGDCTITIGVVAGLQRVYPEVRLAYLDGDADLRAPDASGSGVLDASGIAHLLGLADTPLARIGARHPILRDEQVALIGYDPGDPDSVNPAELARRPALRHFPYADVLADPESVARQVVAGLAGNDATLVVHFDVDAVDSRDLPLANYPHYATGVPLTTAREVLAILLGAPHVGALVLTEVNPTHDPSGEQLARYVDAVAGAMTEGLGQPTGRSTIPHGAP
jgi:arginase